MRFRADLKPFADAAAEAARIAPSRATIPILKHVKIEAGAGEVRLTANDLDRELETRFAATVEAAGATTVDAQSLHEALRAAPKGAEAALEMGERGAILRTGRARYTLPTLPVEDFPAIRDLGEWGPAIEIDGKRLAADLTAVSHAFSKDDHRFFLQGVFLHAGGGFDGLRLVATDGYRLMRVDLPVEAAATAAILPADSVKVFVKLAEGVDKVRLEVSRALARLTAGSTRLISKLIDGTFPDYQRVEPRDFQESALADADELRQALTRALIALDEQGHGVALDFTGEAVKLSAASADGCEAEDRLDISPASGNRAAEIRIGFQGRYLSEALSALGGDVVRFEMTDPGGPAKISNNARADRFVVLMPVRV